VKLLAYRIFDPTNATSIVNEPIAQKPEAKPDATRDAKAAPQLEGKAEAPPRVNADVKPADKPKTSSDLTQQISKRAYELYEKRGRQSDHAVEDWDQAKSEIRTNDTKSQPEPQLYDNPKPLAKAEPKGAS